MAPWEWMEWICFGFAISWCSISMLGTWTLVCNMCFFSCSQFWSFGPTCCASCPMPSHLMYSMLAEFRTSVEHGQMKQDAVSRSFPASQDMGPQWSTQLKESATTLTKRILHTACNPSSSCMSSKSSSNGSIEAVLRRSTACCTPFSGNASTKTTSNRLLWMFLFAHQVLSQSPD